MLCNIMDFKLNIPRILQSVNNSSILLSTDILFYFLFEGTQGSGGLIGTFVGVAGRVGLTVGMVCAKRAWLTPGLRAVILRVEFAGAVW